MEQKLSSWLPRTVNLNAFESQKAPNPCKICENPADSCPMRGLMAHKCGREAFALPGKARRCHLAIIL